MRRTLVGRSSSVLGLSGQLALKDILRAFLLGNKTRHVTEYQESNPRKYPICDTGYYDNVSGANSLPVPMFVFSGSTQYAENWYGLWLWFYCFWQSEL